MPIEIIAALIALVGVVISVVVSLYSSMRQTNTELEKLRSEIQQEYASKLLERRLEVYPALYFILSGFMKRVESGIVSKDDIDQLYQQTNEWDSKNSVFFSGRTGLVSFYFRQFLTGLITTTVEEFQKQPMALDTLKEIRRKIGEFELALKSDLGIYVVEFSDISKRFTSYKELEGEIKKPK